MWCQAAVEIFRASMMDLCNDQVIHCGLIASILMLNPDGALFMMGMECAGGGGQDGRWRDVTEVWTESENAFLRLRQLIGRYLVSRKENRRSRHGYKVQ